MSRMKWFEGCRISVFLLGFVVGLPVAAMLAQPAISAGSDVGRPVADAGLPRYAATDPVQLDGSGSYDPDTSGPLTYAWQQVGGPSVVITDEDTAAPTISGFSQTSGIQECEFELVVSDGELASLADTVKVIIVPAFGDKLPVLTSDSFDPNKPTVIVFRGGDCVIGYEITGGEWRFREFGWVNVANVIEFRAGYEPDGGSASLTYYGCGDMVIVYLSSVAPDYNQAIQTIGASTGGMPAMDVGLRLNLTYKDRRYAVNRVTLLDAGCRSYSSSIGQVLGGAVDGEQCWIDAYATVWTPVNVLGVLVPTLTHMEVRPWYTESLTNPDKNEFNHGVVAGAYWSVVGPGKNLQLASTPGTWAYKFQWHGSRDSGYLDFDNESQYPGRLPEPVTLLDPVRVENPDGVLLSCEESENAVGYQLLFGSDPYRVMDYKIVSDTPAPPNEVTTSLPYEQTWWTVRVRDQYGSTIYADPLCIYAGTWTTSVENLTTGKRYVNIQDAIDDAGSGDVLVTKQGLYLENIDFKGKKLTVRGTNPNDPAIVAATVIRGSAEGPAVTFASGEDPNCVLAGFTITNGKTGIYCSGASPAISNCTISGNTAQLGGGMYNANNSSPTVTNCMFASNSASLMGGGMYNDNSSPVVTNCTFSRNSADFSCGAVCCAGGSASLTNCILWADSPDEMQIYGGTATITYSDIQGGFTGEGNIDTDPLFADAARGDYHLKSQAGRWDPSSQSWVKDSVTSPCTDAGDPDSKWTPELWPHGKRINMGTYGGTARASMSLSSVGNIADLNNDGSVDHIDMRILANQWLRQQVCLCEDLDRNGTVGVKDYCTLADSWLWRE